MEVLMIIGLQFAFMLSLALFIVVVIWAINKWG